MLSTLQIGRNVQSHNVICDIANALGFKSRNKYHVTIAYSTQKVNWSEQKFTPVNTLFLIEPQTFQILEMGPEKDIIALGFQSPALTQRHKDILEAGASWDYPSYIPHISLGRKNQKAQIYKNIFSDKTLVLSPEYISETK